MVDDKPIQRGVLVLERIPNCPEGGILVGADDGSGVVLETGELKRPSAALPIAAAPTNRSPQEPIGRVYVRFSDWAARVVAGRQKTLPGLSNAEESLPLCRLSDIASPFLP